MSRIIIFFLLIAGMAGCTASIDINTDSSKPVIVIYGTIVDTLSHQSVQISSSSPYFDNQKNQAVSGANVLITSSGNETFELKENDSIKGLYQTVKLMAGRPGQNYHLSVSYDFDRDGVREVYEASTRMPPLIPVDSITIIPIDILGVKHYRIGLYAPEPPDENFYLWKYFLNDSSISSKITQYQIIPDATFNGNDAAGLTIGYFEDISAKSNYSEEDAKKLNFLTSGDTLMIEMSNIEKGYFRFISQCQKEFRGENPLFGGPASNIETNITNGGVGYFTAFSISKASAIVP